MNSNERGHALVAGTVAPVGPRKPEDDPKAAQVILHMLQIGAVQIFQDPMVAGPNDIQELSKTHDVVSRTRTELWHPLPGRRFAGRICRVGHPDPRPGTLFPTTLFPATLFPS